MMRPIGRFLASLFSAGLMLCLASCGDAQRTYPVRGKVLFRDKPADGAVVTLVRLGENDAKSGRPSAVVRPDGTFRLSTHGTFDGAPTGAYAVTIIYLSPEKKVDDQNAGPDLLRGKYSNAASPLRVEINPMDNELEPFLLR
jgi:hypothetical protein